MSLHDTVYYRIMTDAQESIITTAKCEAEIIGI